MSLARIGIGTVQFGLDYGISNPAGRPAEEVVSDILARAVDAGVGYLDTAPSYASAEALVGKHLKRRHGLKIVTKTPPIADATIEARHGRDLVDTVEQSLERLRSERLHGLLVHQASDLTKPGWQHIVDALMEVRSRGWAEHIGASVYSDDQLHEVENRFTPEIVQIPVNALDRRAIHSGLLRRLKTKGVEIHARSVFLQGLLLMQPTELPEFFSLVRADIAALHREWAHHGLSPLTGCIAFVLQVKELDAIIIGVNARAEFDEIVAAIAQAECTTPVPDTSGDVPEIYLDPSRWPKRVA